MKKIIINKKIFNIFYFVFFIFVNLTVLLDSYKYPGFFKKHFFLDSKYLFVLLIASLILLFFKNKEFFKNKFLKRFSISFLLINLILMLGFSYLEFIHYENYVYNLFHINHAYFVLFFIEGAVLSLLTCWDWFKKRINVLISTLFLFFLLMGLFTYTFPVNFFIEINKEDQLIETLQFFVVIFSAGLAFLLALLHQKQKNTFYFLFYLFGGLVLLFVAGDEISWGQRIFNFQTPELILQHADSQNEVSIHNTQGIVQYLGQIYLFIGAYGSFSFIIYEILKRKFKKIEPIIKHFFIIFPASLFFFLKFLYDFLSGQTSIDFPFKFRSWSEYTELAMYLGVFIHLFLLYYKHLAKKEAYGKN